MAYISKARGYMELGESLQSNVNLKLSGMTIQTMVQGDRFQLEGSIEIPARELIMPKYDNDPLAIMHVEEGHSDTHYILKSGLQGDLKFDEVVAWIETKEQFPIKGTVEVNGNTVRNEGFYGHERWVHPYSIEVEFEGDEISIDDLRAASNKFTLERTSMKFSEWVESGKPKELPLEVRIRTLT